VGFVVELVVLVGGGGGGGGNVVVLALACVALFPIRLGWWGWRASRYLSIRVPLYSSFLP
jgi:hypothetical protein